MSSPEDNEAILAERTRDLLSDYLVLEDANAALMPTKIDGSWSHGSLLLSQTLLLNLQCRLQKGEGDGDPTMENVAYYIKHLPRSIEYLWPTAERVWYRERRRRSRGL